jgi:hypothetical protein
MDIPVSRHAVGPSSNVAIGICSGSQSMDDLFALIEERVQHWHYGDMIRIAVIDSRTLALRGHDTGITGT